MNAKNVTTTGDTDHQRPVNYERGRPFPFSIPRTRFHLSVAPSTLRGSEPATVQAPIRRVATAPATHSRLEERGGAILSMRRGLSSTSLFSTFIFLFDPRGGLGRALQQCNAGTTLERSEQAPDPLSVAKITNRPRSDTEQWKRVLLTMLRVPTPTDLLVSARTAMSG
ncbi:unnamed protein product [Caenorhabditis auriculariae]|uniref:Uncharacterized protein n=1 Tax=Caenorhabditis auriculariae TaxID=2777116 RepID=A0A8S1HK67_9PELO|nr:unnamed protein product [Caenorhabditis auriculariae]